MNILVSDIRGSSFYFRTDNTLTRDPVCTFYIPDFLERTELSVGLAFRIDKPAKHVDPKFADRYISSFTPGLLIYGIPADRFTGIASDTLKKSLDNSTLIPLKMQPINTAGNFDILLEIGQTTETNHITREYLKDLSTALLGTLSGYFSFKTGDIIFAETKRLIPHSSKTTYILKQDYSTLVDLRIK